MASTQSWFVANAGSDKQQNDFSVAHTRIMLELKTLKLENPEYFAGDLFIRKHVAAFA